MRPAVCFCVLVLAAFAQTFKSGEAIEYKDGSSYPPKWERGVFVKMLPGGTQALIRKKPSQFFPEGSESAFALDGHSESTGGPCATAGGESRGCAESRGRTRFAGAGGRVADQRADSRLCEAIDGSEPVGQPLTGRDSRPD